VCSLSTTKRGPQPDAVWPQRLRIFAPGGKLILGLLTNCSIRSAEAERAFLPSLSRFGAAALLHSKDVVASDRGGGAIKVSGTS